MKRSLLPVLLAAAFIFGIFCSEGRSQIRETGKPAMQCEKNFDTMDADHDGLVTKDEFAAFEHKRKNADEIFKARDADHDGKLTKEEFCTGKGAGQGSRPQPR